MVIKRQFTYWVNLDPTIGKEIKKTRPCLVLSSNIFNKNSGLVTIVPITKLTHKSYSNDVNVYVSDGCVDKNSRIKADQIRTVDASRIIREIGKLPDEKFKKVKEIIKKHLNV